MDGEDRLLVGMWPGLEELIAHFWRRSCVNSRHGEPGRQCQGQSFVSTSKRVGSARAGACVTVQYCVSVIDAMCVSNASVDSEFTDDNRAVM